jgi:predicted kinase
MPAAQFHQLSLYIVHCTAPLEVLHDRLSSRTGDISDATTDLLGRNKQHLNPLPKWKTLFKNFRYDSTLRGTIGASNSNQNP